MRSFPEVLLSHGPVVEQALRRHVSAAAGGLPLYRMMQYQLGWVDRDGTEEHRDTPNRLFGALCAEAFASFGDSRRGESVGLAAASVVLLHESVVVHEDMQVAQPHREGRDSVWWIWGPAQAINVGDGLHALARLAVFNLRGHGLAAEDVLAVVRDLDDAALRYYEGQYLDLTYQERVDVTEAQYVRAASSKAGALFSGAVSVGARTAGASADSVSAFRAFGERLGLAYQVREDVDVIWGEGGEGSGRLLNKSKLYPVVLALETAPLAKKRELGAIYFKRVMEPSDLDSLRRVLAEVDAREQAMAKVAEWRGEALALLDGLQLDEASKGRWVSVVDSLLPYR